MWTEGLLCPGPAGHVWQRAEGGRVHSGGDTFIAGAGGALRDHGAGIDSFLWRKGVGGGFWNRALKGKWYLDGHEFTRTHEEVGTVRVGVRTRRTPWSGGSW